MTPILPPYILTRTARCRSIRVSVKAGGVVTVRAPYRASSTFIKAFLLTHALWLHKKVRYFKKFSSKRLSPIQERKLFVEHKARAHALAVTKVVELNKCYGFSFGKISIRNSRSRWGSCSSKGTLCFNYKIAFLPEHLADYLVVHELCHLKERNHGKGFWSLVACVVPDYALRRKELRDFERAFKPPPSVI